MWRVSISIVFLPYSYASDARCFSCPVFALDSCLRPVIENSPPLTQEGCRKTSEQPWPGQYRIENNENKWSILGTRALRRCSLCVPVRVFTVSKAFSQYPAACPLWQYIGGGRGGFVVPTTVIIIAMFV